MRVRTGWNACGRRICSVYRFGGKFHTQLFKYFDIHVRQHNGGVYLASRAAPVAGTGLFWQYRPWPRSWTGRSAPRLCGAWDSAAHILDLKVWMGSMAEGAMRCTSWWILPSTLMAFSSRAARRPAKRWSYRLPAVRPPVPWQRQGNPTAVPAPSATSANDALAVIRSTAEIPRTTTVDRNLVLRRLPF